jgi:hydroxyethylthiazole kinase-like uncharacterized protein yjeF
MRPVLTAAQSAAQDAAATVPPEVLIDRAGLAVALAAVREGAGYGARVAVLVGPGNNGGDGYVAARYLRARGAAVTVHPLAEPKTDLARHTRRLAELAGVSIGEWHERQPADLVIDALFGGGFRGELPDLAPWKDFDVPVVAVDVPSGLSATTGEVHGRVLSPAVRTVTFHGPKVGHLCGEGPDLVGALDVVDIGLPGVEPAFWECEESDAPLPVRARTAHKWSSGSVLVVGGSGGLDGAATLAAQAALHAGAGAVMIASPPSVEDRVRAPEIMTRAIGAGSHFTPADVDEVLATSAKFDALIVGPGLGLETGTFVPDLLARYGGRVVLDADGLNALEGTNALTARTGPTVITPHAGEFQRLTGEAAGYSAAAELADAAGIVVLLKGAPTFVMSSTRWAVTSGGRELATIGTGDVLAGMIAALWSAGFDAETAARSAAYWHGVAGGELALRRVVTAERLVEQVGVTLAASP